jgi:protein TonB
MFEQATLSNANAGRRAWTTGLGFLGEAALVALIALAPIVWPEAMPKPRALLMPLTPPAPAPPPINVAVKPRVTRAIFERPRIIMPASIPTTIARVVEDPPEAVLGVVAGAGRATGEPWLPAILNAPAATPAPLAAVRPAALQPAVELSAPKRIRISSIELARLVHRVEPLYPPVAKLAHISGTVELTGVIATDGHIRELRALSGNPLLIAAALAAVSQWIYAPPILNGERVEVIAPITVNFRLDR